MRESFIGISFALFASFSTFQLDAQTASVKPGRSPIQGSAGASTRSNQNLINALIASRNLYVRYVEDGAADGSVLAAYPDSTGTPTNKIAEEVKNIVELRDKAIPLLINHLDDTRPTSAITYGGGYLTDKQIRVPVGHICLDILLNIVGVKNRLIFSEVERGGFGSEVNDGYYFRPDDYRVIGDLFEERPIVRIVKTNWQKAYRAGRIKYDYVVTWK